METALNAFITQRFAVDANWCNGNCYWFAHILATRFQMESGVETEICYMPVTGHFVVRINDTYYDWTGKVSVTEPIYPLKQIQQDDPKWYKRIAQNCIL